MTKKLPPSFSIKRYGLDVRLVNEEDASFILNLRLDPIKSKFLGKTDSDIQSQIDWIRNYKVRESNGTDYYFIYYINNRPAGVNRIYEIKESTFIHGSWLFANDVPPYCPLAAAVIARQVAFYDLELKREEDTAGIHVENVSVWQFAQLMGEEFTGIRTDSMGNFKIGILTKESFEKNLPKILRLIPKKVL